MSLNKTIQIKEFRVLDLRDHRQQYLQHGELQFAGHDSELDHLWRSDRRGNHAARDVPGAVSVLKEKDMIVLLRKIAAIVAAGFLLQGAAPSLAQQAQPLPPAAKSDEQKPQTPIRVTSELVLANVVVRDKKGNLVRDLKKDDFTLYEDGKKQQISTFDFENVDELETAGAAEKTVTGEAAEPTAPAGVLKKSEQPVMNVRDRRVIVFFFDFSAMEPEQIDRCVDAAKKYVNSQMHPADLVALVSLATNMRVDLDFTDDKAKILSVLNGYSSGSGEGFDNGDTGSAEGAAETGGSFTPDDTDYNTFSADRKLLALQSTMDALGKISQKKVAHLFQQRNQPDRNGQPVDIAVGDGVGGQEQCFDLSR